MRNYSTNSEDTDSSLLMRSIVSASKAEIEITRTREQLLARADVLAKEFAHYGVKLNLHALRDPHRRLLPTARHVSRGNTGVVMSQLTHALDDLELALVERG